MNIDLTSTQTLIILLQGLLIVAIAVFLAKAKNRSLFFWGTLALFFGVYALFVLVLLPRSQVKIESNGTKEKQPMDFPEGETATKEIKAEPLIPQVQEPKAPDFSSGQLATADWFFINEKKEAEGPFRLQRFQELVTQGRISDHTWVWCELFSSWRKINTDEMLKSTLLAHKPDSNK